MSVPTVAKDRMLLSGGKPVFKDEATAFREAVDCGGLSRDPSSDRFSKLFNYLGHFPDPENEERLVGIFKHKVTPSIIEIRSKPGNAMETVMGTSLQDAAK